jgi:transcriptional regulator with XRE-family HTH domain
MSAVGAELRRLRNSQGLTLEQLSSRSGLSSSFISQVERSISSPSIVSLEKLCAALDVHVSDVLAGRDTAEQPATETLSAPVIRRREGLALQVGTYPVQYRHISGTFPDRRIEALVHEIPPGHRSDLVGHEGEEFGYVLEGKLILQTEATEYELETGDSYHFFADAPHGYGTTEDAPAVVLVISTQKFVDWYESALSSGIGKRRAADAETQSA